jgi:2-iminobutanoate/2-iminopropanoate deaminase
MPLSRVVKVGDMVFVSGQVGVDTDTGSVRVGDVRVETRQVLRNVEAALRSAGCSLRDVVKVNAYLADMADFAAFNEEYVTYFPTDPPARTTVGAALVQPYTVEVDAVAITGARDHLPGPGRD